MDWNNIIETEDSGMCGGKTYYSFEDVYQEFKSRLKSETLIQEPPKVKVTINKRDYYLPRPEQEKPKKGTTFWVFNIITDTVEKNQWDGLFFCCLALKSGLLHLTESRAKEWKKWWDEFRLSMIMSNINNL